MVTGDQELQWAYLLCPTFELSNSEGKPLTNGYIELYIAGTRDKYYAASDFAGTLHPFQIPLDSLGSNIVLVSPDNAYDIYVYNRFGNLVMSRYNVVPTNGAAGGGSSSSNISIESGDGTVVVTESTDPETGIKTFDLSVPSVSGNPSFWTGRGAATMGVTISDTEYHKLDISNHSIRNRNDDITVVDGEFNLKKGVYFWNVTVQLDKHEGHDNTRQRVFIESGYNRGAYTMDMTHDETETISFSGITVADYDDTKQDIKIKSEGESPFKAVLYNVSIHKLNQNVLGDSSGGHTYIAGDYIEITEDDVINVTGLTTPEDVEAMIDAAITALASGDMYTAGDYINIENHVINVTGLQPEGDYLTPEDLEGYATEEYVTTYVDNSVSSFVTEEQVTAMLPETEDVTFKELDITQFAQASAIPDVSDFATHTEVYESTVTAIEAATAAIPDQLEAGDYIDITNNIINVTGLQPAGEYLTPEDLEGYATESYVTTYVDNSVSSFTTNTEVYEAIVTGVQLATAQIPDQLEAGDYISIVNNTINVTGLQPEGDYATNADVHEATVTAIEHVTALIPEAQVQSDWTEADTADPSYIQHKPQEVRLVAGDNVTITETATSVVISASGGGPEYTAGANIEINNDAISLKDVVHIDSRNEAPEGYIRLGNIVHWGHDDYGPGIMIDATMDDYMDNRRYLWYNTSDQGREDRYWGQYDFDREAMSVSAESYLAIQEGDILYRRGNFDWTGNLPVIWSCSGMRYDIDRLQEAVTAIPESEEVQFEEINLEDYALASAIPTVQLNDDDQVTAINNHEIAGTGGTTYTAGDYIDITNDTISVTGLDNSNTFFATVDSTTWQAVKDAYDADKRIFAVTSNKAIMPLSDYYSTRFYFATTTNSVGLTKTSPAYRAYELRTDNSWVNRSGTLQANWNETSTSAASYIKNKPSIPQIELNSDNQVTAIDGHTLAGGGGGGTTYTAGDYISIDNDEISVTGVGNLVAGNNITITESGDNITISAQGGGSTYTAGQYISIDSNDVIAVTGLAPVSGSDGIAVNNNVVSLDTPVEIVPGDNITISVTGASAIISAQTGGGSTYSAGNGIDITNDVISIDNTVALKTDIPVVTGFATVAQVSAVSAAIPELPDEEEVDFEEISLSDYALASAIPDVSNFVTDTEVTTEITEAVSGKQDMLTGITDVQVVTGLPVSPTQDVLYLIVEA